MFLYVQMSWSCLSVYLALVHHGYTNANVLIYLWYIDPWWVETRLKYLPRHEASNMTFENLEYRPWKYHLVSIKCTTL